MSGPFVRSGDGFRLHLELVEDSHGHSFVIVNGSS